MHMNDYMRLARVTAIYPDMHKTGGLLYTTLGLCGESGEFADKVKKILRDGGGVITEERRQALIKELGDVLWYASQCAVELDTTLADVARENLEKLAARYENNSIKGSGDDR